MSRHTPGMRRWLLTIEEENKMTTQPEALRVADEIQRRFPKNGKEAAAELRRLHESNTELLAALQTVLSESHDGPLHDDYRRQARAAIAKAERTTT